jgi:type II secretory pathway pseudopilin PulG
MGNLRNSKGVTLLVLTITIIVLLIITSITIGNFQNQLGKKNLNNLYSDIEAINTKISEYYLKNNSLPIYEENAYMNNSSQLKLLFKTNGGKGTLINVNDENSYYVINLSKLENLTLNYGREYDKWDNNSTYEKYQDLYIINEVTHQVYYPNGVKYNGKSYFTTTLPENVEKIQSSEIPSDGLELTVVKSDKNYISDSDKVIVDADINLNMGSNFMRESLKYGWNVIQDKDNIEYSQFSLDSTNSAKLTSKNIENKDEYYLYVNVLDINGKEHILEEKINDLNSKNLILGLVDDLGTSSTIYLYGNSEEVTSGNITITMPDNTTNTITATNNNSEISNKSYYATYTVMKNGAYTFKATQEAFASEITIEVSNIEKFELVDNLGLSYVNSEQKAYNYKGAAVPKGFYVDTKADVNTGLVITDKIDSEGYSTGNEWVWVPVNSTVGNNDYYITESGSLEGATTVTYTKYSKLYSFSSARTRDPYGTFYAHGNAINGGKGTLVKPSTSGGYREPAILVDTTYGETKYYNTINQRGTKTKFTNVTGVASQYITDYNNMVTSVDKYKGFYIGRYELTGSEENGKEKRGKGMDTPINWYQQYNSCMTFDNNYVTGCMIYGTLWDTTLQWLAKSGYNVGYTGEPKSGYGNYFNEEIFIQNDNTKIVVKKSKSATQLETGQVSYTKSNNIYDLTGNAIEWTQTANAAMFRVRLRRYMFRKLW